MTYGPNRPAGRPGPPFDNVFVNPESYREFMKTGRWPEGTTVHAGDPQRGTERLHQRWRQDPGRIARHRGGGQGQKRYPDGGWSYFSFDGPQGPKESTAPFARTATCYACHSKNGAVEWTFTQFYPSAFEVAQRLGTVRTTTIRRARRSNPRAYQTLMRGMPRFFHSMYGITEMARNTSGSASRPGASPENRRDRNAPMQLIQ